MFGVTHMERQYLILILSCSFIAAAVIDIEHSTTKPALELMSSEKLDTEDAITSTSATPTDRTTQRSEVKKFLRRVQSTLEKAEPFLDEVEKEAKRLEQTAKQFGEGLLRTFKGMMGRIIGSDAKSGIPSFFGIIRIGGNQGSYGITKKQEEPCVTENKITETKTATSTTTTTTTTTTEGTATKMELPVKTTTQAPDLFVGIVEDANSFDNEI